MNKTISELVNYTIYNLLVADAIMLGFGLYIRDLNLASIFAGLGFLCLLALNNLND